MWVHHYSYHHYRIYQHISDRRQHPSPNPESWSQELSWSHNHDLHHEEHPVCYTQLWVCENIFQNSFTLQESKSLDQSLSGYKELEDIKNEILDLLFDGEIKIEEKENEIFLNIKRRIREISIPLKKYDEKTYITYNTLSDEMKRIIDNNKIIIGIDLGTTYSCASVMLDNKVFMIQNFLGLRVTPSYVCFLEPNKVCIGELAKLQPSYECKNII